MATYSTSAQEQSIGGNEARVPRTGAQTTTVSASNCAHGLEETKDQSPMSSNVLLLLHPENTTQVLLRGRGSPSQEDCPPPHLPVGQQVGQSLSRAFFPPWGTSSPRPLVMGMTSLAEGELQ